MDEFKNNEHAENDNINGNTQNSLSEDADYTEETVKQNSLAEDFEDEIDIPKGKSAKRELVDWIISIIAALAIAFLLREYVFTIVRVEGDSMEPTLSNSDVLFLRRFMYTPKNGDIVVFDPPVASEGPYVKRVIAVEGQEVYIDANEGKIYVDGVALDEYYVDTSLSHSGNAVRYPYVVPPDHIFAVGDNRHPGGSYDSRDIGPVHEDRIMGKVVFRIMPFNEFGNVYK